MKAFEELLRKNPRPTAVLCSNDMTAIGVCARVMRRESKFPRTSP